MEGKKKGAKYEKRMYYLVQKIIWVKTWYVCEKFKFQICPKHAIIDWQIVVMFIHRFVLYDLILSLKKQNRGLSH